MKYLLLFIGLSSCFFQSKGQENIEVVKEWNKVRALFSKKGQEGKTLATIALDSKTANETIVDHVLVYATRVIFASKETTGLDSTNFYSLHRFNDSLDVYMGILMRQLENDKAFLFSKAYPVLKDLYKVSSDKLYVAMHYFNQVARKYKSRLLFEKKDQEFPEVDFD